MSWETWNPTHKPSPCEIKLNWFEEGTGKGVATETEKTQIMKIVERRHREIHEETWGSFFLIKDLIEILHRKLL